MGAEHANRSGHKGPSHISEEKERDLSFIFDVERRPRTVVKSLPIPSAGFSQCTRIITNFGLELSVQAKW